MKTIIFYVNTVDKQRNYYHDFAFDLEELNKKPIQGYLDHNTGDKKLDSYFPPTHEVNDFKLEEDTLFGEVTFLDNVKAKILMLLLRDGKVVLRPKGSITRINNSNQVFHFSIDSIDVVSLSNDFISKPINYDER